ncbi:hypothetical protein TSOC_012746 [Tetrabaena socialis]|uniref:VWFA domain-containing protein n=1 Tax=Tetrabaena socialis TaxID=47790 RepID=A0A2J7ZM86_9CHLO|nr:hypothetical protein TSOC_012746 [Tetrabaena socialis]|eukprot:PNH01375.1 hypothetical protein TSOC_012746 [Tetrabaena socialis]
MEAAFRARYDDSKAGRSLTAVQLFDDSRMTAPSGRFHIVFCLDESGSMAGQKWSDVVAAYRLLISRRQNDQALEDVVSVITFSSWSRSQGQMLPLARAPASLTYTGGDTSFAPPLADALAAMQAGPADCTPLLVFMSDGQNHDGGTAPLSAMGQMVASMRGRNLQVHTIAFQALGGEAMLRQLAAEGGGTFHSAADGVQLARTFSSIAAGCTAMDALVQRFGDILSEQIAFKIRADFL